MTIDKKPLWLAARSVGLSLCAALGLPVAALASSLIVPDNAPTVQAALDAGVDTVFVRSGSYPDTPLVSAPVAIVGIPGDPGFERPLLAGMRFRPVYTGLLPLFSVTTLDLGGPVYIQNDDEPAFFTFNSCHFRAGIFDVSAYPATAATTLRACRIENVAFLKADGNCIIDSCVVEGQLVVGQEDCRLFVTDSEFHGTGSGDGISTIGLFSATITGTVIDRYGGGIVISALFAVQLDNNIVRDCGTGIFVRTDIVRVMHNRVERCGGYATYGMALFGHDSLTVVGNTVSNSVDSGLLAVVDGVGTIVGNVVWKSGRDGIHLGANLVYPLLEVRNNTSCFNAGSGILSECSVNVDGRYEMEGNIGYGNSGYGVRWGVPEVSVVRCNDWFGNGLGDVQGRPPATDDFSADPLFCNPDSGDFHLRASSPLVDWPGCGLVGALGLGCGVTATVVQWFTAERVSEGVRVLWEVAEGATASEIWLERSEGSKDGEWIRSVTERSDDGRGVVELDRSAVSDRTYWYRLVAREGLETVVLGAPLLVESAGGYAFALRQVAPNPGSGPVRIGFSLARASVIDIEIFDVQGRGVVSLARGVWPPGQHVVEWNGLTDKGVGAPAGWYVVRYRYPGGQDSRRLVRSS